MELVLKNLYFWMSQKDSVFLVRALGHLPQGELAVFFQTAEVSALFVLLRAPGHFHEEGQLVLDHVSQQPAVHDGPEIVRVGDEDTTQIGRASCRERV